MNTINSNNSESIIRRRKVTSIESDINDYKESDEKLSENKLIKNNNQINYYLTIILNYLKSIIFKITGIKSLEPPKNIINHLLQKFPIDELSTLSAEELFARKLQSNEYNEAMDLAINYGFDVDIVYQRMWRNTQINEQSIDQYLSKISKRFWALRECVECVAQELDHMKLLLQFGLKIAKLNEFKTHFKTNAEDKDLSNDENFDLSDELNIDLNELSLDLNELSLEEKQICIWRKRLLIYLDRLTIYELILSYRGNSSDKLSNKYNHKFYQLFRDMSSFEAAIHFARNSDYNAISILFTYEGKDILDHRLVILSNFAETLSPKKYESLLPKVVSPKVKGHEVYEWNQIRLREEDWVEKYSDQLCSGLNNSQFETDFYTDNTKLLKYKTSQLTKVLLTQWYSERSRQIISLTSLVSNAFDLIEIGLKHSVPGLEKLHLDFDIFVLIVYESNCNQDIDFEVFENYSNEEKMNLLMSEALKSEEQFMYYIENFLKKFISKVCKEDQKLLQTVGRDLFRKYLCSVARNNLDLCLKVFENSSLSNIEVEKLEQKKIIEDPSDLIEFALDCIYASEDIEQLETAFKIMECLPQRDMVKLIANNDSLKIKRLNELNDDADKLEKYLIVAEIIEQYDTPPTISQINTLEKSNDREGVKQLFTRLTRSCAKNSKPIGVNEWIEVFKSLQEVRKMCFTDCISEDELFEIFVQTLLCSARKENFGLAATFMQLDSDIKYKKKVIPFSKSKKLLITAAQEYINSSDSAHDFNVILAKECLQLIDEKEQQKDITITEELNFIEALIIIEDNFDVKLLPIQIRLILQPRIELIEKILKSSTKAYTKTSKILKVAQLMKVCNDFGPHFRDGTVLSMIAKTAFDVKDYKHCFNTCELLMKNSYSIGWKICLKLGLNDNYNNIENRLQLLCFALTYCDSNEDIQLLDIINAIKHLKTTNNIKFCLYSQ